VQTRVETLDALSQEQAFGIAVGKGDDQPTII